MAADVNATTIEVGQDAPDFTLVDDAGEKWTLSEHRDRKVVLVFYPLSFSGICTKELHELTGEAEKFAGAEAEVVGISIDSKYVQAAFKRDEKLEVTLLADFAPRGAVAQKYGVFIEDLGIANRGTFVVDRQGKVAHVVVTSVGEARNPDDYLQALQSCS
ncbi:MAG: peroxiredoxin [Candidatus Dormibacteraeota bacterium]|nr:peroxiredoxin [Candidatus Dormibacteraeota bacterium]